MKTTFTMDQYNEAKVAAKEFGINPVGKKKEDLINLVNAALAEKAKAEQPAREAKKEKWYKDGYGYNKGDVVEIVAKTVVKAGVTKDILKGRKAEILGPSENEGMVKAILINEKSGDQQNCPITLEISKIFPAVEVVEQVAV